MPQPSHSGIYPLGRKAWQLDRLMRYICFLYACRRRELQRLIRSWCFLQEVAAGSWARRASAALVDDQARCLLCSPMARRRM